MDLGICIFAYFCRLRKVRATNLILPSMLDLRSGVMIISISRYFLSKAFDLYILKLVLVMIEFL